MKKLYKNGRKPQLIAFRFRDSLKKTIIRLLVDILKGTIVALIVKLIVWILM